jgi:hypothetical protein
MRSNGELSMKKSGMKRRLCTHLAVAIQTAYAAGGPPCYFCKRPDVAECSPPFVTGKVIVDRLLNQMALDKTVHLTRGGPKLSLTASAEQARGSPL